MPSRSSLLLTLSATSILNSALAQRPPQQSAELEGQGLKIFKNNLPDSTLDGSLHDTSAGAASALEHTHIGNDDEAAQDHHDDGSEAILKVLSVAHADLARRQLPSVALPSVAASVGLTLPTSPGNLLPTAESTMAQSSAASVVTSFVTSTTQVLPSSTPIESLTPSSSVPMSTPTSVAPVPTSTTQAPTSQAPVVTSTPAATSTAIGGGGIVGGGGDSSSTAVIAPTPSTSTTQATMNGNGGVGGIGGGSGAGSITTTDSFGNTVIFPSTTDGAVLTLTDSGGRVFTTTFHPGGTVQETMVVSTQLSESGGGLVTQTAFVNPSAASGIDGGQPSIATATRGQAGLQTGNVADTTHRAGAEALALAVGVMGVAWAL